MTDSALPHGLRPAIAVQAAAKALGPTADPVDPIMVVLIAALLLLGMAAWWWSRRLVPVRRVTGLDDAAGWQQLAASAGDLDWYERLGRRISVRYGNGHADNGDVSALLTIAARRDATGAWAGLMRRWEWALYGGYPGLAGEHRSDLTVAQRGWP
jgi:hypothetical protein